MYDTESIKKQAIVDFSSRKRTSNKQVDHKTKDQLAMKALIEEAKVHALEELKAFRRIMEQAKAECADMVLFEDASRMIDEIFIRTILEQITEPVIKGTQIPNMDPTVYKEMRKAMYRELIHKYCKDKQ